MNTFLGAAFSVQKSSYRPFNKASLKLALFKEEQRSDRRNAANHVGAAVLAHVARSSRSDATLWWKELTSVISWIV